MLGQTESKQSYYKQQGPHPSLVELYFRRMGGVDRVLDLGCGTGQFGQYPEVDVVGVDIDVGALNQATEYERVCRVDLESGCLPFEDRVFDGIVAKDILEHLQRPSDVIGEMHRVLSEDGVAVVSVPMAKPRAVWEDYTHVRGFTRGAIRTMFQDYGFEVLSITPMGGVPGAGRLGIIKYLPYILRLPVFRRYATSHEAVITK